MSNTGKTSTYIRKTNVKESLVTNTGFKKTRFLHQATVGDTLIQLTSLTTPSGAVGYSAPNVSELSQTNLMQWSSNVTLTSSVRGLLIQNISYVISGASTIKLLFSALDAEIFEGVIDHNARTGLTMVDAAPLVVSGTLLAGQTDFNVGTPFKVGMYPSAKRGVIQVEVDGQPAYRTDGNVAFGPGINGDYYEVHSGGGLGQILRFNADLVNDRFIMVTSVGALVEKPNGSIMAVLETVQGQIDAIVPTLAELAGVAETNFQSAPNNTDLKSFGDRVLELSAANLVSSYTPTSGWQIGVPGGSLKYIAPATVIKMGNEIHVSGSAFFRNDGAAVTISWTLPYTNGNIPTSIAGTMARANEAGTGTIAALQRFSAIANNSGNISWTATGIGISGNDGWYFYSFVYKLV